MENDKAPHVRLPDAAKEDRDHRLVAVHSNGEGEILSLDGIDPALAAKMRLVNDV